MNHETITSLPLIYIHCRDTKKTNPYDIACELMENPAINMRGPEHHVLVGSALLAAYHNCGGQINLPEALETMAQQGGQIPRGVCGNWGNCGSGISAGIFMSIISKNTSFSDEGWRLANRLSSKCLESIALSKGPLCCKRDGFLAIQTAADFVAEHCGVQMELPERLVCNFSSRYDECPGEQCLFYNVEAQ